VEVVVVFFASQIFKKYCPKYHLSFPVTKLSMLLLVWCELKETLCNTDVWGWGVVDRVNGSFGHTSEDCHAHWTSGILFISYYFDIYRIWSVFGARCKIRNKWWLWKSADCTHEGRDVPVYLRLLSDMPVYHKRTLQNPWTLSLILLIFLTVSILNN